MTIDEKSLVNKVLLVITPIYPTQDESVVTGTFVKNQVAELKQHFKKVIIILPVIRAHFTWPSGYIGVELKEKYGKPVINTIRGKAVQ